MWLELIALVCTVCCFEIILKELKSILAAKSKPNPKGEEIKTAWEAIAIAVRNPGMPNYILLDLISKIYGRVAVLKMHLTNVTVAIADMTVAKSIMSDPAWVNRLPYGHFFYDTSFNKPVGLVFSNGEYWKHARKTSVKLLHQCGFFKVDQMQPIIQSECIELETKISTKLSENGTGDVCFHELFQPHIFNIIARIVFGKKFEEKDAEGKRILKGFSDFNHEFNIGASIVDIFPWLRYIPGLTFVDTLKRTCHEQYDYIKKVVDLRRKRQAEGLRPEKPDFMDLYVEEIRAKSNIDGEKEFITDEALLVTVRDILFAGTDTTSGTLEYAILYLLLNPEVQAKVHQEIDDVIDGDRRPDFSDRDRMPYIQATILEILRLATPVPFSARSSVKTNKLDGYVIPKNSMVTISIYSIHQDTQTWEQPEDFRPERFLENGTVLVNTDKIISFGYGKRSCLGESTARLTIFIFLASLLQKFQFSLAASHGPPSLANLRGISRTPVTFWANVALRK